MIVWDGNNWKVNDVFNVSKNLKSYPLTTEVDVNKGVNLQALVIYVFIKAFKHSSN